MSKLLPRTLQGRAMDEREDLERRAAQCRRLADGVSDRPTAERLKALAAEFEATARALAADQPPKPA
jgi:hypothetical protein